MKDMGAMKKKMAEMGAHMKKARECMKEMEGMMGDGEFDDAFHEESTKDKKGMM